MLLASTKEEQEHTRNFSIFVHRILNSTSPNLPLPSFFEEHVKENYKMPPHTVCMQSPDMTKEWEMGRIHPAG